MRSSKPATLRAPSRPSAGPSTGTSSASRNCARARRDGPSAMDVDAHTLRTIAADTGYAAVKIGKLVVRGKAGWDRALSGFPPATPSERREMFLALEKPLLVATAAGRARLRKWLDARRGG